MRRIYKTPGFKAAVVSFNRTLFLNRPLGFEMPIDRLDNLLAEVRSNPTEYQHELLDMTGYILKIQQEYFRILDADDAEMETLKAEFEVWIAAEKISEKFYKSIVKALRYEDLRDDEFLYFLSTLGIKTCVYCHSQLTLVIKKTFYKKNFKEIGKKKGDVKTWKGLLELDHKHAKSKYPFLATSFYNLYPVCGSCNKAKSKTDIDFLLYSDSPNLDVFKFYIEKQSLINYKLSGNPENLEIGFSHILAKTQPNDDFLAKYDDLFSISKIYNTQKDLAEELVIKQSIYNKPYVDSLISRFQRLFPNKKILRRLLIGNYDHPDDVHRRPMAKFVQDISEDIGL